MRALAGSGLTTMGSSSLMAIGKETGAVWNMTTAGIGIEIGTSEIGTTISSQIINSITGRALWAPLIQTCMLQNLGFLGFDCVITVVS
jgi:hypothetical protein